MLNELAKECYETSSKNGFWDKPQTVDFLLSKLFLVNTELAEVGEELRKINPLAFYIENGKPEGEAVEVADAIIRLLDYSEARQFDIDSIVKAKMEYNKTRPYMHGKKA